MLPVLRLSLRQRLHLDQPRLVQGVCGLCYGCGALSDRWSRRAWAEESDLSVSLCALVRVYVKPSAIVSFAHLRGDYRELHRPDLVHRRGGSLGYLFEPSLASRRPLFCPQTEPLAPLFIALECSGTESNLFTEVSLRSSIDTLVSGLGCYPGQRCLEQIWLVWLVASHDC
ncbi:hypothetical protein VNO77_19317 [Canavalia gladiata]|uniref:Uncharacterized protein n=1 Tax=Canavalia gladiata TaxID=3824 RepID=A0AAN9QL96_CANGL